MAFDPGIAGMLGRPDLSSGYGTYMAQPVVGMRGGGMDGSGITGGVSVQANVGTGQASLGLAAAMVVLFMVLYFSTRSLQH